MATIYSNATDGFVYKWDAAWDAAHDATTGNYALATAQYHTSYGPGVEYDTSGPPPHVFQINRNFFSFDVSSITVAPTTATFWFYHAGGSQTGDIIPVLATGPGLVSGVSTATYNDIYGYAAGFNNTHLTALSSKLTVGTPNASPGYEVTLNAWALAWMGNPGVTRIDICLMNYDHDYLDVAPTVHTVSTQLFGMSWNENTNIAHRPKIVYTPGVAAYAHETNSVSAGDIGEVISVSAADVSKLNSVG